MCLSYEAFRRTLRGPSSSRSHLFEFEFRHACRPSAGGRICASFRAFWLSTMGPAVVCRLDRRQSLLAILRLLAPTLIVDEPNVRLLAPRLPRSAQIVTGAGARSSTSKQFSPGRG